MIRAVLDANVLASAFIQGLGPSGRILGRFLHGREFDLVLSRPILQELGEIMFHPRLRKRFAGSDVELLSRIERLGLLADLAEGDLPEIVVKADKDDDIYVAAALHGRAGFVVSGDRHLLDLLEHQGVRFVAPREFLRVLDAANPA